MNLPLSLLPMTAGINNSQTRTSAIFDLTVCNTTLPEPCNYWHTCKAQWNT